MSKRSKRRHRNTVSSRGLSLQVPVEATLAGLTHKDAIAYIRSKTLSDTIRVPKPEAATEPRTAPSEVWLKAVVPLATNAWRLHRKMVDQDTNEPREEYRKMYRHVEAMYDALKSAGVEIDDPSGQPYDSGMALKVVSFEQRVGISREEIIETIKPTITWNRKPIQIGEVVVGTP